MQYSLLMYLWARIIEVDGVKNISFCLARRICITVENEQAQRKHLEELKQTVPQQKYPLNVINRGIDKVLAIPQSGLRQPNSYDAARKILPVVTTYNQNNPSVFSTIQTTFEAFCENEVFEMKDCKLKQCRRQPANLKKILTKAERLI